MRQFCELVTKVNGIISYFKVQIPSKRWRNTHKFYYQNHTMRCGILFKHCFYELITARTALRQSLSYCLICCAPWSAGCMSDTYWHFLGVFAPYLKLRNLSKSFFSTKIPCGLVILSWARSFICSKNVFLIYFIYLFVAWIF